MFYYIQATIAYFNMNVDLMKDLNSKINPEGKLKQNISIINNLIHGIEEYGNIDYYRDYFNKKK